MVLSTDLSYSIKLPKKYISYIRLQNQRIPTYTSVCLSVLHTKLCVQQQ